MGDPYAAFRKAAIESPVAPYPGYECRCLGAALAPAPEHASYDDLPVARDVGRGG